LNQEEFWGSSTFVMGKGRCRAATLDFGQTRECLVSRQTNLCVLKGRRISPVPSGHFHLCHQYPARCAGLISSVAPRPPKGALKISPTINIEETVLAYARARNCRGCLLSNGDNPC
jgi:hypothetical protein